jgi:hypothetical protein
VKREPRGEKQERLKRRGRELRQRLKPLLKLPEIGNERRRKVASWRNSLTEGRLSIIPDEITLSFLPNWN